MNEDIITIQTFVRHERERITQFLDNWLANHARQPDAFPLEMPAGEWDEQYWISEEG